LETESYREEDFLRYLGNGAPMKRILEMTVLLIFSGVLVDAQTPAKSAKQYTIDVLESRIEFYVSSSDGEVYGTFASWTGQLKVGAPGHPEVSTLNLEVFQL
jgi:polyisoprenoid-binding protein YceI